MLITRRCGFRSPLRLQTAYHLVTPPHQCGLPEAIAGGMLYIRAQRRSARELRRTSYEV